MKHVFNIEDNCTIAEYMLYKIDVLEVAKNQVEWAKYEERFISTGSNEEHYMYSAHLTNPLCFQNVYEEKTVMKHAGSEGF